MPTLISLIESKWKETEIKNLEEVIKYVEVYKLLSYTDYILVINKKNFSSMTERDFILKIMGIGQGCRDFAERWIRYKGEEFIKLSLE